MDINNFPITINFKTGKIFGILRGINSVNNKIVICCPATTGTRIGPQRIFVEIAQKLTELNIATFCVDIPPLGDSFDTNENSFLGTNQESLTQYYSKYLEIIIDYLKNKYDFKEFILLTISDGGLPIYNYAREKKEIKSIILLSPNHKLDAIQKINKKNLYQYYNKIFRKETWIKILTFKLNLGKIFRNIYQKKSPQKRIIPNKEPKTINILKNLLIIFGEKEQTLNECLSFWNKEASKRNFENYSLNIVDGADHSFFGWIFKKDVEMYITDWFNMYNN